MAKPIQDTFIHNDAVEVTDFDIQRNTRTAATLDFEPQKVPTDTAHGTSNRAQLKVADDLFGPFAIGTCTITRSALDALGATVDNQPLSGHNTFYRVPKRSFINGLQFDPVAVEARMKVSTGADAYLLPTLLFEMAGQRPLTAPPLLRESPDDTADPDAYQRKLKKLLNAAHALDIRHAHLSRHSPRWVSRVKSVSMLGSSVGIQGFGIFMGIRGIFDAARNNNKSEIVFNSVAIGTELSSIAADVAVTQSATQMLKAGQSAYRDFAKTRFAVRLGRSGGLVGGALTLPFDIYSAIRSFTAADNATGKEALDHYVSAGLSITSAAMTAILGAAAMAGFSFAGPVGLAAGAILAIGSQIYGAVRTVDEIDDYIELTTEERWRTGWFSFCFMNPDDNVRDRYTLAKARVEHSRQLKAVARKLLDGNLKDTTEAVVNGTFEVTLKPTRVWTRNWWTKEDGWETVKVPQINGGDDQIDARDGVTAQTPGAELGRPGEHKSVLWFLGDGQDSITGVIKKTNAFHYAAGTKQLTGGDKDDRFVFEGAAALLNTGDAVSQTSTLSGGGGNDSLVLGGKYNAKAGAQPSGYVINLPAGTLHVSSGAQQTLHSLLESVENIETVNYAQSTVVGTDGANIIRSRGRDTINAGAGDDQVYLLQQGSAASGEGGKDEYFVAHVKGSIAITEDGIDDSVIALNWRMELIESWVIEQNSLVITSGFEFSDVPKSVVVINGIYQKIKNQRQLKNRKLVFITQDGFHLTPDLPEHIANSGPLEIEVTMIRQGLPARAIILYAPDCHLKHGRDAAYFVPKTHQAVTFRGENRGEAVTRIHLDDSSDQLTRAEAHFRGRLSDKDHDLMVECDLVYHLGDRSVTLKSIALARGGSDPLNITKVLRTLIVRLNSRYILAFKNGVACNALLTPETEVPPADARFERSSITQWITTMTLPLTPRSRAFFYDLPENSPHVMSAWGGCAKLTSYPEQTAMESLTGNGSVYLVHLSKDMTLRLATPGALASAEHRLDFSSSWELDATQLSDVTMTLDNNQLRIGTTTVHLPNYSSDDLIDQVRIITANGIVHTVDLTFESIYLDGLDARFFAPPTDPTTALSDEFSAISGQTLRVRHVEMKDGTPGGLSYDLLRRRWVLDTDTVRAIDGAALKIVDRCAHQKPALFKPVEPATVPVE